MTSPLGGGGSGAAGNLSLDKNLDGIGDGAELNGLLTEYTALIPGTGSILELRISYRSDSDGEEVAFDRFILESAALPDASLSLSHDGGDGVGWDGNCSGCHSRPSGRR